MIRSRVLFIIYLQYLKKIGSYTARIFCTQSLRKNFLAV